MKKIAPSLVLCAICLVAALLLSVINMFTSPIIKEREDAAANAALAEVLPGGSNFAKIELNEKYPASIVEAYSATGGFVFRVNGSGRNGTIVMMIGVDAEGKISGTKIITEAESKGYGDKVYAEIEGTDGKYTGQTLDTLSPVIVGGATMTSNGVAGAIEAALKAYVVANGGSVDNRTPEQILQDNCNAALGTEGKTFTKWFATAVVTGVDEVYETDGGKVYVIGEHFIGVDGNGNVVTTDVSSDDQATVLAAHGVISEITLSNVQIPDGAAANIVSIKKASNGAYLFELTADGYQVMFEYGSRVKINILLSISADGKIIDVLTVSHKESAGVGDVCATEDYYEQYRGKENSDITISADYPKDYINDDLISPDCTDIGAIASATYTTVGYQKAVKAAFEAFELLEGGNQ